MQKIQAKQVHRLFQSTISVAVSGVTAATSLTPDLATAATGAGWRGVDVPNQEYVEPTYPLTVPADLDTEAPGWRVDATANRVDLWIAGTEDKLVTANGEEVFGRLVTGGAIELFTLEGDVETAYELTVDVDLTAALPYVFTFHTLPLTALGGGVQQISQDPKGNTYVVAALTLDDPVAQTFEALDIPLEGVDATVNVNGQVHELFNGAFAFDAGGTIVTWDEAVAGFEIATTDTVTIRYTV